jgi:hypothetical protein
MNIQLISNSFRLPLSKTAYFDDERSVIVDSSSDLKEVNFDKRLDDLKIVQEVISKIMDVFKEHKFVPLKLVVRDMMYEIHPYRKTVEITPIDSNQLNGKSITVSMARFLLL